MPTARDIPTVRVAVPAPDRLGDWAVWDDTARRRSAT
jgi:hypothetical protein